MYASALQPADGARAGAYGAIADIPPAMFRHFMTLFQSASAPDPHDVAEAIRGLINLPKGTRPARTVVGTSFGSDTVNAQTAPVQANVIDALGLSHLGKIA